MTADDVRTVMAFGKRIALCIMAMSEVVTDAAKLLPPEAGILLLARVSKINREMTEASESFTAAAVRGGELDS